MTNEHTPIDLRGMNEEELKRLHEACNTVIDLGLADLTNWADSVVAGIGPGLQDELMSPAAQTLMHAAGELMHGDKGTQDRLAYVLFLDALIASPDAVQASLRTLRDGLVANDTALALVK